MSAAPPSDACWACGGTALPDRELPLLRCEACGLAFAGSAAPDVRELYDGDYFESYLGGDYRDHEQQRRRESRLRLEWMAAHVPAGAELLELGAAAGFFLDEALRAGYHPVGLEPNPELAAEAAARTGVEVRSGFLADVTLPAGAYDAVCAWHVLEHIVEPLADLERLRVSLRPGGALLLEVPNGGAARARHTGAGWPLLGLPHHVAQYSPRALGALLARAGFDAVALDTIPFSHYHPPRLGGLLDPLAGAALASLRARRPLPPGPHPSEHELLRAVARVAA